MIERPRTKGAAPERPMLEQWLDRHRATLAIKCDGLTPDQLRIQSVPPSSLSLLGLVRHLADVERWWFRVVMDGQPDVAHYWDNPGHDSDFDDVATADVATDFARWQAECDAARAIAATRSLDDCGDDDGETVSLRWVYVHMIEEYARHNGHADLIRERIDGVTGD
jgi:uncharacterized damage-inducible protein DinB